MVAGSPRPLSFQFLVEDDIDVGPLSVLREARRGCRAAPYIAFA